MPSRQLAGQPEPATAARAHAYAHAHAHGNHHPFLCPLAVAAAVAMAVSVSLAVLLYRRCRRTPTAAVPLDEPKPAPSPLRRFTYSQLRRAAGDFAPSHRLGQGGFGPVFRGAFPSGQEVAVKLMDSGSLQGEREFQNELSLAEKILAEPYPDRKWVVAPFGFCVSENNRQRWWKRPRKEAGDEEEEEEVAGRRLLLVYEIMHNGSLQDALLERRCAELADWARRFSVAIDIARGLHFLHAVCDPPVIHGDIKPSNILLDAHLSARIADFGLARIKTSLLVDDGPLAPCPASAPQLDDESIVEIDLDKIKDKKREGSVPPSDDASVMGDTVAESTTTTYFEEASVVPTTSKSPGNEEGSIIVPEAEELTASPVETTVALEVASTSEAGGFDKMSMDSGKDTAVSSSRRAGRKKSSVLSGKDWWWRQDAGGGVNSESGGSSVKDYVMEWIRSEIKKERPKSDWITPPAVAAEDCLPRPSAKPDRKKQHKRLEWWALLDEERSKKEKKRRPAREWWREEFCEELTNKHKMRMMTRSNSNIERREQQWWQKDDDGLSSSERRKKKKRSWSRGSRASVDRWTDGLSREAKMAGRRSSRDRASSDIPKSSTISSTPSMRGTVCYVAPEYGGGGPPSEKCDIYSFGVLLLVLISGRRPLQVMASPMSEFERANLISWARHLAHSGRLLDLVDPSLQAVDKEQVLLCITVALLCIQRSPAHRPSIKDIVGMLTGESEPPNLPLEFSPSPPGGFSSKYRKRPAR